MKKEKKILRGVAGNECEKNYKKYFILSQAVIVKKMFISLGDL